MESETNFVFGGVQFDQYVSNFEEYSSKLIDIIFSKNKILLTGKMQLKSSARWVQSTINHCTVHSLSSVLSINPSNIEFLFEKVWECREWNPGPLGEKQEHYQLCYSAPLIPNLSLHLLCLRKLKKKVEPIPHWIVGAD